MSRPDESAASEQFGAGYWEGRYQDGEGASRHGPSPALVTETAGLQPGRALDAGCGVGADALWLAARGWQVTAVDVSLTALRRGRQNAEAAGPALAERIEWVHGDLTEWEPGRGDLELVSSHYVHVPGSPEALFRRLASWVTPGGTLLVVGHDGGRGDRPGHGRDHPPGAQVQAEQIVGSLPADQWSIIAADARTSRRPGGDGPVTLDDVVVHARRQAVRRP